MNIKFDIFSWDETIMWAGYINFVWKNNIFNCNINYQNINTKVFIEKKSQKLKFSFKRNGVKWRTWVRIFSFFGEEVWWILTKKNEKRVKE